MSTTDRVTTAQMVREFSVLLTVRVCNDHPETLAWLKEGLVDGVLMVPDVVDVDVDTIVEVKS